MKHPKKKFLTNSAFVKHFDSSFDFAMESINVIRENINSGKNCTLESVLNQAVNNVIT